MKYKKRKVETICADCGKKYGEKGVVAMGFKWYSGRCDICGKDKPVTNAIDFGV